MSLFRLDTSIRTEGSVSREVTDTLEKAYLEQHPGGTVIRRDLGTQPLPADLWATATFAGYTPEDQRSEAQKTAVATAKELVDELLRADSIVVGAPLYNFGVSQHLKTWIDVVITDPRFAAGVENPLAGRPVAIVVARGGGYGAGTPREGWDHGIGWLSRIFADVWGGAVTVVEAELTLADTVEAMAALRPLAAEVREKAHQQAAATGKEFAQSAA
ncbi:FMN-dependent NADH-azoreductase [Pseudonocardia sp. WMMC193]|uniref:FMN-dependent NADH-azoreductase n=1 Tax=Pseudonocardia sp. WMMC193 TaxID=2911965 RepID=UPI001F171E01|nr:NAD(P)H-dependent oxidoreductase [Pseudonocardia sp. WMMC193]MCF7552410.1 NAD(P)H-dependent oxidoreductase [Pseudonocardia sp. WMMC193]